MQKLTKSQVEEITRYAKEHFTAEKDPRWPECYDVLMDGRYITMAAPEYADEDFTYRIPVGDPKLSLAFEPAGTVMLLVQKEISKVESYKDFKPGSDSNVACIGFSEKNQAWTGWSYRACCSFKIGDIVGKGNIVANHGYDPGFKFETLEDCRKAAIIFAQEVA